MRIATIFFFCLHIAALGLGLFGILFAIPHTELWTHPADLAFFSWALQRGGSVGMITGALAMIAWGGWAIGWRRTLIFAAIACTVSAAAELTGTKTGWPFGGYEYLTFLDWKIAGRVPYGVPLSWFYMGFAAYVLALKIVPENAKRRDALCILLATWLLTAWDLVLDPAMVALPQIKFWAWHEHGAYYGMPLRNLAGWFATGATYMTLSRLAWRSDLDTSKVDLTIPFGVYAANIVWSIVLAGSAGLWPPALAAIALSLIPAALALRGRPRRAASIA
jgi:carotene biosynthesis associated membrane protein